MTNGRLRCWLFSCDGSPYCEGCGTDLYDPDYIQRGKLDWLLRLYWRVYEWTQRPKYCGKPIGNCFDSRCTYWLDWHATTLYTPDPSDDAVMVRMPVSPTRGVVKAWIAALRAGNEPPAECAQCDELIGERDRAQDALQDTHIALGGDGEWVGRSPPQPAPDSGDLHLDVPELARERMAELERLRAAPPPGSGRGEQSGCNCRYVDGSNPPARHDDGCPVLTKGASDAG